MVRRIVVAVFVSVALAGAGALAACPPDHIKTKTRSAKARHPAHDCVDLDAVPQISDRIVATEPARPPARDLGYHPPGPSHYEGPTLGLAKPEPGVRPAPTVGYHWSLQ